MSSLILRNKIAYVLLYVTHIVIRSMELSNVLKSKAFLMRYVEMGPNLLLTLMANGVIGGIPLLFLYPKTVNPLLLFLPVYCIRHIYCIISHKYDFILTYYHISIILMFAWEVKLYGKNHSRPGRDFV